MFCLEVDGDSDFVFSCPGIKIQRLQKSQVHIDLDFKWGGDGDIVLNIGVMGTELPVQVLGNGLSTTLCGDPNVFADDWKKYSETFILRVAGQGFLSAL